MAMTQYDPIYFTPPPVRGRYPFGLWKDSPSQPSAPDPVATANAQGTANLEAAKQTTALSHADQITPYGTLKWTQGGGTGFNQSGYDSALKQYQADLDAWNTKRTQATQQQGVTINNESGIYTSGGAGQDVAEWEAANARPTSVNRDSFNTGDPLKWTSSIELDPRVQSLLDAQLGQSNKLTGAADTALDRVTSTLAKDPTTGLPPAATAAGSQAYADKKFTGNSAAITSGQNLVGSTSNLAKAQADKLASLYGTDFNYNNVSAASPVANEAARKQIEDSLYANSTARLDPQYQQGQSDLDARLATQGITQGSAAWQRENQNMNMAKTDAYANARNTAVTNSTDQMQKLFNMGLAARQQGVNEANTIRQMPTTEALAASTMNSGANAINQGNLATQTAQNTAAGNLAAQDFNMNAAMRATANSEQTAQRQQVLNELNALRTGSQVQMPTFQGNTGGAAVGAAPIAQTTANDYASQMAAYNAQLGSQNSMMGGLASLGVAGIGLL